MKVLRPLVKGERTSRYIRWRFGNICRSRRGSEEDPEYPTLKPCLRRPSTQTNKEDTMRLMIFTLLMLCVRSGRLAPYGNHTLDKRSLETCKNIRLQAERIIDMIIDENFTLTLSSTISSEKDCGVAKCAVLQKLSDYYNCTVTFQNNGDKIKNEIKGLIENLQMLKCSDEEKTCNLPNPSCHLETQQISMWIKTKAFVDQVFGACLYTMQHVCPKLS